MTTAINQKNPFIGLPYELIDRCLYAAGNPLVFETCRSFNLHQKDIYGQAVDFFSKQPLIRQLFPKSFEHDAVLVIPCIDGIFQSAIRRMYAYNFLDGISPLATFQAAHVVEDWSALMLFSRLLDYIPACKDSVLKGVDRFTRVIRYSKSNIKKQSCIRNKAAEVDLWMKTNIHLFEGLRQLTLQCEMAVVPRQIAYLPLRELNLKGCRISYVMNEIGSLIYLEKIDLSSNLLSGLPLSFRFLNVREVYLQDNRFTTFPAVLCDLEKMTTLNLSRNQLKNVPEEVPMMQQLLFLDLSHNQFVHFPEQVTELSNLCIFKIGCNLLNVIPPCISSCTSFTYLDIMKNPLSSFPDERLLELINFHHLHSIGLSRDQYKLLNPRLITHLEDRGVLPRLHRFRRSPKIYDLHSIVGIFYSVQQMLLKVVRKLR